MMPRWAMPLAWMMFMVAAGTVLATITGCQMPLR